MVAPLKLKREKVGSPKPASSAPVLSVLVDTGVYHLDQEFDYLLPEKFEVAPGEWVSVPFKGKNRIGLVTKRSELKSGAKLSFINKPILGPKISSDFLHLYRAIASRWAVPIFDVLRFVTRFKDSLKPSTTPKSGPGKRYYLQLDAKFDEVTQIRDMAIQIAKTGSTILIVPERRLVDLLASDYFHVGLRGSILNPKPFQNVIILREDSEHHYEIKSPGFNTRDIALLRNEHLNENLYFLGFTPSLEMASLIAKGYVTLKKSANKIQVIAKPSLQGELLPSGLIPDFKKFLDLGTVLVVAPAKGYGLAISCANCRNVAKCPCGGRLTKRNRTADPNCTICSRSFEDWRCSFCEGKRIYLLGRGIERIAEELGKSFPNTSIHLATVDKDLPPVTGRKNLVIATLGAAPIQIYSAVLFLDGLNLAADLRSTERALSSLMRYAAMSQGRVMVVERPESPIINSLIQWNPFSILNRELEELKDGLLPPSTRHVLIQPPAEESARIYSGLQSALRDGRLSSEVRIYNLNSGSISLFFPLKSAAQTLYFLHEFQRRRSISGKGILKMRVDPYMLG